MFKVLIVRPCRCMPRVLFVGGPWDGKWVEVDPDRMTFEVNCPEPMPAGYPPSEMAATATLHRKLYTRQGWRVAIDEKGNFGMRFVFSHNLSHEQLFDKLLEAYKPADSKDLAAARAELAAYNRMLMVYRAARGE